MVTYSFHEFQFTKIGVPSNQQMIPRKLVLRWRVKVSNWKHLCTLIKQSNQIWWFGKLCSGKAVELLFPISSWAWLTKKISEFFLGFLKKKNLHFFLEFCPDLFVSTPEIWMHLGFPSSLLAPRYPPSVKKSLEYRDLHMQRQTEKWIQQFILIVIKTHVVTANVLVHSLFHSYQLWSNEQAYLIIVTGTTSGACVKIFCQV